MLNMFESIRLKYPVNCLGYNLFDWSNMTSLSTTFSRLNLLIQQKMKRSNTKKNSKCVGPLEVALTQTDISPLAVIFTPPGDANGRPRTIWTSEMRRVAGDALILWFIFVFVLTKTCCKPATTGTSSLSRFCSWSRERPCWDHLLRTWSTARAKLQYLTTLRDWTDIITLMPVARCRAIRACATYGARRGSSRPRTRTPASASLTGAAASRSVSSVQSPEQRVRSRLLSPPRPRRR
jgi:hypothetical protein